jgi:hypothetical protein
MNILLDMILLFVVLNIILVLRLPDLTSNHLLLQQVFIYLLITTYYVVQKIVEAKIRKESFDIKEIVKKSFANAIPGLFGFILFTDLRIMEGSKMYIDYLITSAESTAIASTDDTMTGGGDVSRFKLAYTVSLFITLFTLIIRVFPLLIDIETYI